MVTATKPRTTWLLKGCPRCKTGDLQIEDGEMACLQCSYRKDLKPHRGWKVVQKQLEMAAK